MIISKNHLKNNYKNKNFEQLLSIKLDLYTKSYNDL